MPATYDPIATVTVSSSSTAAIDFSNIPQTYTDLVLVSSAQDFRPTNNDGLGMRFNWDSGTNYSETRIGAERTGSLFAEGFSNRSFINAYGVTATSSGTNVFGGDIVYINDYINTTNYKTTLGKGAAAHFGIFSVVGQWRNNSAINSIQIYGGYANTGVTSGVYAFASTSTFTLYGIKAN